MLSLGDNPLFCEIAIINHFKELEYSAALRGGGISGMIFGSYLLTFRPTITRLNHILSSFVGRIIISFLCMVLGFSSLSVIPKFSYEVRFVYLKYRRILKTSYVGVENRVLFAITVAHHWILHLLLIILVLPSIFTVSRWKYCIPKSPIRSPPSTKTVHLLTIFFSYRLLVSGCVLYSRQYLEPVWRADIVSKRSLSY